MSEVCCKSVFFSGYWSRKCGKPAKFEVNGLHYCGIHNPNKAKTKAQIEAEENYEKQRVKWRLEAAAPHLLNLLVESQTSIGGDWRERRDAIVKTLIGEENEKVEVPAP